MRSRFEENELQHWCCCTAAHYTLNTESPAQIPQCTASTACSAHAEQCICRMDEPDCLFWRLVPADIVWHSVN